MAFSVWFLWSTALDQLKFVKIIAGTIVSAYFLPHWLYASQYIKASLILPSLHSIALVLLNSTETNDQGLVVENSAEFIRL